jgi:hypothetical protein
MRKRGLAYHPEGVVTGFARALYDQATFSQNYARQTKSAAKRSELVLPKLNREGNVANRIANGGSAGLSNVRPGAPTA